MSNAVLVNNYEPLKVIDRCDRCPAQAFMRAYKEGYDLLFCGHHGREFLPVLAMNGFSIQDETHKINIKPTEVNDE